MEPPNAIPFQEQLPPLLFQKNITLDCGLLRIRQLLNDNYAQTVAPSFLHPLAGSLEQLLQETKIILKYIDEQMMMQGLRSNRANLSSKPIMLVAKPLTSAMDSGRNRKTYQECLSDLSKEFQPRNSPRKIESVFP